MGGPSQSGSTGGSQTATAPQWLKGLIHGSANNAKRLMGASAPELTQQLQANPEQIAQLTPEEQSLISQLGNFGSSPDMASAESQLSQLTGGPIGSSPDTQAAMRAYNTQAVPAALQAASLSGAGRGGGTTEALTMGREAAYTPLVQQEIQNRMAAVPQYQNMANLQNQFAQTGLEAEQLPQQVQQEQFQAVYQDLMRRFNLEQQATLGPLQQFGSNLFGLNTIGTNSSSMNPGGLATGIGITNSASNLLGSLFGR